MTDACTLPRLLYVGDVPVEHSVAGSTLLFRNLQRYPADRLLICEMAEVSSPERRLTAVNYVRVQLGATRLAHTRFAAVGSLWRQTTASLLVQRVIGATGGFKPEAILTVAHGWSWHTAALVARKLSIPLHLIVHDHPPLSCDLPEALECWTNHRFGRAYRQAVSRLCISPWMERHYREEFGLEGSWLYPCCAVDAPVYAGPPEPRAGARFTLGFAGTITDGYAKTLRMAAAALEPLGGEIVAYSSQNPKSMDRLGLRLSNVRIKPLVPYHQLLEDFRQLADGLLLPLSFRNEDRIRMVTSFQSKLADYSLTGLPILIFGPGYASAVQWARDNPGVAEVVDHEDPAALGKALDRICRDRLLRLQLASRALEIGRQCFAHSTAWKVFAAAMKTSRSAQSRH